MQALTTFPSTLETLIVPHLGFEFDCSCKLTRRKKEMRGLAFPVCYGSTSKVLNLGFGSKLATNCEVRKGYSFVSAWALEEQTVGNEISVEKSVPENGLLGECGNGDVVVEGSEEGVRSKDEEIGILDVRALASSLQFAKTADDVEEVMNGKGDLPLQVFSIMIRGFGRDRLMDSTFAVVEWLKRRNAAPNLFIFNSLLGAVKQSKLFGEMEKVLADMMQEGVEPNFITYNIVMAIYVEQGLNTKALEVLEDIQKKGLVPSPVTYSIALLAYQRMQDGVGASEFFVEFREKYRNGDICRVSEEDGETEFLRLESFTKHICYRVMRQWLVNDDNLSISVLKLLVSIRSEDPNLGQKLKFRSEFAKQWP